MNKKIKSFISLVLGILTLVGIFAMGGSPEASALTCTSATLTGEVIAGTPPTRAWFQYNTDKAELLDNIGLVTKTVVYDKQATFVLKQEITDLAPNTKYFYRLVVQNNYNDPKPLNVAFFTTPSCPVVTPPPTVDLKANGLNGPITIPYNSSVELSWTSTDADSCIASNGWSGSKPTANNDSKTETRTNITSTKTFTLTCYNSVGSDNDSVTVDVEDRLNPSGTISASDCEIASGASSCVSKVSWSTENLNSTYPVEVRKDKPNSVISGASLGNTNVSIIYGLTTFSLYNNVLLASDTANATCPSDSPWNGSKCYKQTIIEKPTVKLSASPTTVTKGGSTKLTWDTTNADSCIASNGWSGSKPTANNDSKTETRTNITSTKTFTLTCYNSVGSDNDSVTVDVEDRLNPSGTISASDCEIASGASSCVSKVSWSTENLNSTYPVEVRKDKPNSVISGASLGNTNVSIIYGLTTFSLYNNVLLASDTAVAQCTDDSEWNGNRCVVIKTSDKKPTAEIFASPFAIKKGDFSVLSWSSKNTKSCGASWTPSTSVIDTQQVFPTQETTYTIICRGDFESVTASTTVGILKDDDDDDDDDDEKPTVSTNSATNIDEESATLNGFIDANGNGSVRAWFEWGTANNDYDEETTRINYGNTSGTSFDYDLDNLDNDETYYFRAVAENSDGDRVYGSQRTFTTDDDNNDNDNNEEPEVTTYSATDIEEDSATLRGYVDTNGSSTRRWFEWGTRSSSLSRETDKSSRSSSSRNFEDTIDDLNENTTYYFRAVAENDDGDIDYGKTLSFRTDSGDNNNFDECDYGNCESTAITTLASNIGQTSARLNGLGLVENGVYTTGYFEYGTTTFLGLTTQSKNIGNGQENPFFESLFGLRTGTIYYFRAVISNQYGTSRGDIIIFRTLNQTVSPPINNGNTTVVYNTGNTTGSSKTSLVSLSVIQNNETIRKGDVVEYLINYENTSAKDLRDIILRVSIPKELEFMETNRGYFSAENSTVVVNIGDLDAKAGGSVRITARVSNDAEIDKIVVVTANLVYTIVDNKTQEEVFAYAKSTVEDGGDVQLGALAFLFGDSFLPHSLLGWLLLILLITLITLAVRKAYNKNTPPVVVGENNHQ